MPVFGVRPLTGGTGSYKAAVARKSSRRQEALPHFARRPGGNRLHGGIAPADGQYFPQTRRLPLRPALFRRDFDQFARTDLVRGRGVNPFGLSIWRWCHGEDHNDHGDRRNDRANRQ